jgi:hypothetical protein
MKAPARPPSFFDALSGADVTGAAAQGEPGYLLDDLAGDVRAWPHWLIDDGSQRRIRLTLVAHDPGERAVIGFAVGSVAGRVTATPDPSGYLRIMVEVAGAVVLVAFAERVWEEYDLWPPGAVAGFGEEPPGRMGKHRNWLSISASGWPVLAGVANSGGWLNLMQLEEKGE